MNPFKEFNREKLMKFLTEDLGLQEYSIKRLEDYYWLRPQGEFVNLSCIDIPDKNLEQIDWHLSMPFNKLPLVINNKSRVFKKIFKFRMDMGK